MTAKSSALTGAIDGSAPTAQTPRNREAGDARHNSIWRELLIAMLGAQLTNLDSMVHGYKVSSAGRRAGSTR